MFIVWLHLIQLQLSYFCGFCFTNKVMLVDHTQFSSNNVTLCISGNLAKVYFFCEIEDCFMHNPCFLIHITFIPLSLLYIFFFFDYFVNSYLVSLFLAITAATSYIYCPWFLVQTKLNFKCFRYCYLL